MQFDRGQIESFMTKTSSVPAKKATNSKTSGFFNDRRKLAAVGGAGLLLVVLVVGLVLYFTSTPSSPDVTVYSGPQPNGVSRLVSVGTLPAIERVFTLAKSNPVVMGVAAIMLVLVVVGVVLAVVYKSKQDELVQLEKQKKEEENKSGFFGKVKPWMIGIGLVAVLGLVVVIVVKVKGGAKGNVGKGKGGKGNAVKDNADQGKGGEAKHGKPNTGDDGIVKLPPKVKTENITDLDSSDDSDVDDASDDSEVDEADALEMEFDKLFPQVCGKLNDFINNTMKPSEFSTIDVSNGTLYVPKAATTKSSPTSLTRFHALCAPNLNLQEPVILLAFKCLSKTNLFKANEHFIVNNIFPETIELVNLNKANFKMRSEIERRVLLDIMNNIANDK